MSPSYDMFDVYHWSFGGKLRILDKSGDTVHVNDRGELRTMAEEKLEDLIDGGAIKKSEDLIDWVDSRGYPA